MTKLFPSLQRSDGEIIARFGALSSKDDVADLLEIPPDYLRYILYRRKDRLSYRTFKIRKRSGGERLISAPPPALDILQTKLNRVFQLIYRPKPCVHGFVNDRSVLSNATPHTGRFWVLNVDLKDYFTTIHFGRVRGALMARPFHIPRPAATILAQICTADGVLPQGAPTSPVLANIVSAKLDGDLMLLARRYRLTYTRYCDDLTLSCRRSAFPQDVAAPETGWIGEQVTIGQALLDVIEGNGFKLSYPKTRLQLRSCHQEVTGLTVNIFPNVSREYVKGVRGMLYAWRKHGLSAAASVFRTKYSTKDLSHLPEEDAFKRVVRGRLEYIGFVRGRRDPVYCKLRNLAHSIDSSFIAESETAIAHRLPLASPGSDRWSRQFARLGPSVFQLEIQEANGKIGHGTAFALTNRSLATAAHNLIGHVTVHGVTQSVQAPGAQVHARSEVDAALLPHPPAQTPIPFDRRLPQPGEEIAVIGFASLPQRHQSLGIYVGTVESLTNNYARSMTFINVSVASGGGLSGSPVIDARGLLIGIVIESVYEQTASDVPHREYCTVLPISYVLEIDPNSQLLPIPLNASATRV